MTLPLKTPLAPSSGASPAAACRARSGATEWWSSPWPWGPSSSALAGTIGASLLQIRQDQITDTYEATYAGVTQADIAALKEVPEIARVGTYYVLSTENSPRGFQATYLYVDQDLLYTFRHQMSLAQGRLPQGDHEVALGADWLAQYANGSRAGGYRHPGHPQLLRHLCGHRHPGPGDGGRGGVSHGPLPTPPWRGGRTTTPPGTWPTSTWPGTRPCLPKPSRPSTARRRRTWTSPVPGFSNVYFRYHDSSYLREVLPMVLVLGGAGAGGGAAW